MSIKKSLLLVLVVLTLSFSIIGCGKSDVKDAMRGEWSYAVASIDGTCYKVFNFNSDGTYKCSWINTGNSSKSSYSSGTYKIKSKEIILTEDDGSAETIIEYKYKGGNLSMFDVYSDRSGNHELSK